MKLSTSTSAHGWRICASVPISGLSVKDCYFCPSQHKPEACNTAHRITGFRLVPAGSQAGSLRYIVREYFLCRYFPPQAFFFGGLITVTTTGSSLFSVRTGENCLSLPKPQEKAPDASGEPCSLSVFLILYAKTGGAVFLYWKKAHCSILFPPRDQIYRNCLMPVTGQNCLSAGWRKIIRRRNCTICLFLHWKIWSRIRCRLWFCICCFRSDLWKFPVFSPI